MNEKLRNMAKEAGFPVTENGDFGVKVKQGLFGYQDVDLEEKIEKLAELLFNEFVSQWWVSRHGKEVRMEYSFKE